MKRMLIVDDNTELIQRYFWPLFARLLPLDKFEIVHAPLPGEAVELLTQPWDIILLDYFLGPKVTLSLGESGTIQIKDGQDLVHLRRTVEQKAGMPRTYMLGIADTTIGNLRLQMAGANSGLLKLHVPQIAEVIRRETQTP